MEERWDKAKFFSVSATRIRVNSVRLLDLLLL
jgi:hypothetical protein